MKANGKNRMIGSIIAAQFLCVVLAGEAQAQQRWRCSLDLHQGDTGTLEFTRRGQDITGETDVRRGSQRFRHAIEGAWRGSLIEFRRELSPSSYQPFEGIALEAEDDQVKMAGRFAFRFSGIWSADCGEVREAPRPTTYKTGSLEIRQTWAADLDEGVVGTGPGNDVWFEAQTATQRYLTPRNGARIAVVGSRSVGREGCASAPLSGAKVPMARLTTGTYVCVLTDEGRYSQFRVNTAAGPSPGTLVIGYTTWDRF